MLAQVPLGSTFLGPQSKLTQLTDVGSLVSRVIVLAFSAAGIILVVLLIVGGIGIIASAGSSNPQGAEQGKKAITSAITGFVIVFIAYWIVKLIEIITGAKLLSL